MISIRHSDLNTPIELSSPIYTVVCERPELFARLVSDAVMSANGESSGYVVIDEGKEIKFLKTVAVLTDYFSMDAYEKKINALLSKKLLSCMPNKASDIYSFYSSGYAVMRDLLQELDIHADIRADVDYNALIKLYNPTVTLEDGCLLEKLIDYVNLAVEFDSLRVLIAVNLKGYLSEQDFLELSKHLEYKEVHLVSLEPRESYRQSHENMLIIDKDLCEILVLSEGM